MASPPSAIASSRWMKALEPAPVRGSATASTMLVDRAPSSSVRLHDDTAGRRKPDALTEPRA